MSPRASKLVLTSHLIFSVGWVGAVAVFIALAIKSLTTTDIQLARSAYVAMEVSTWYVIIPFCLASFVTGLIQAIATKWGLFKHYWIVVKLILTLGMTVLLLLHLQPISYLASKASVSTLVKTNETGLLIDLLIKAGAAMLTLLFITAISVFKPWGRIALGKKESKPQVKSNSTRYYLLIGLTCLIIVFIALHLLGDLSNH